MKGILSETWTRTYLLITSTFALLMCSIPALSTQPCHPAFDLLANIERMSPLPYGHPAQTFWLRRAQHVAQQLQAGRSYADIQGELDRMSTPELRPLLIWAVVHLPFDHQSDLSDFRREHLRLLRQVILKLSARGAPTYTEGMRLAWHILLELETDWKSEMAALDRFAQKTNALLYILSAFQTADDFLALDSFSFPSGPASTFALITRSRESRIQTLAQSHHPLAAFLPTVDPMPLAITNTQRIFPIYPITVAVPTQPNLPARPLSPNVQASQAIAQGWYLAKNDLESLTPPSASGWTLDTFTQSLRHIFARMVWERFRQEKLGTLSAPQRVVFDAVYAELVINRGWSPSPYFFWDRQKASKGDRGFLETLEIVMPEPLRGRYGDAAIRQALTQLVDFMNALSTLPGFVEKPQ